MDTGQIDIRILRPGERGKYGTCGEGRAEFCFEAEGVINNVRAVLIGVVAEGKIWVSYVMGRLKPLLDAVVKRFNIRNVVFCTIINPRLLEKLRNIVRVFELPDDQHGEATTCIEVEWVPTDT